MTAAAREAVATSPYGEWVVRLRWYLIVASAVAAIGAAYGIVFLSVNPDNRVFFDENNPERLALEALENTYTRDRNIMIVVVPDDGEVFTRETLGVIEWLTERAWKTPYSRRVDSITNFQHTSARGDDLVVRDLVEDAAHLSDAERARVRDIALSRPELRGRLIAPLGGVAAVNVSVLLPGSSREEVPEVATFVRALVAEARAAHPGIRFLLTGAVMIDVAFDEASHADMSTLVPLMLALIVLIIGLSLRAVVGTAAAVLVIAMSVSTTLGVAGWAGLVINAGTSGTPIVIMTLSVANCVHLLATMNQEMRAGLGKHAAIIESLRVNMTPIAVTSLTTAIGFLTLNFADSPPLREFGSIVAGGVTAAFAYAVVFLPAMVAVLPVRAVAERSRGVRAMNRIADFVVSRRRGLLAGTAVAVLLSASGLGRIVLDDDFIRYFDDRFEFRRSADFVEDHLTGINALQFSLPAGEEQGIFRPSYLADLEAFATWFRRQDSVAYVSVLTDKMKRLNQNMNGDDPAYYRIPESRELAAQFLMLYELSLPFGFDLNSRIDVARSETRFVAYLPHVTSARVRELAAAAETWLLGNAPDMWTRATGSSMVWARISERNIKAMLGGTLMALVMISFILIFVFRSVRLGLISLVPNLIPAAVGFGIWGYLFTQVNLAISVVVAMTLGIVVDDTVHFLSKYLRGRRDHGMDPTAAVRFAFRRVGMALWITSLALCAGFAVLATSGFALNGDLGLLSAITIAVALIADFFLLPPLLIQLDRKEA